MSLKNLEKIFNVYKCIKMRFVITLTHLGTETFMQNLKVTIHSKKRKSPPPLCIYVCLCISELNDSDGTRTGGILLL